MKNPRIVLRLMSLVVFAAFTLQTFAKKTDTIPPPTTLPGVYADPYLTQFGDTYYIYPTTDGTENWMSTSFTCWSSKDLIHWKNEGVILDLQKDITWAKARAWAPCIVEKQGKFYFYFCADANIGVAVSDKPTGPFQDALGKPLVSQRAFDCQSIDPMVLVDENDSAYFYFGQGKCMVVGLNADMISFPREKVRNIKPKGYNEGTFTLKRKNKYYLMWSEFDTRDPRYSVAYAISDSPYGPFVRAERNPVLQQKGLVKGAGHHSVLQIKGTDKWIIAYHRFKIPGGNGYNRETVLAPLKFDAKGAIIPVDVFAKMKSTPSKKR